MRAKTERSNKPILSKYKQRRMHAMQAQTRIRAAGAAVHQCRMSSVACLVSPQCVAELTGASMAGFLRGPDLHGGAVTRISARETRKLGVRVGLP